MLFKEILKIVLPFLKFQMGNNYLGLNNFSQVIQKIERLFSQLESGYGPFERLFDPAAWSKVAKQLTSVPMTLDFQIE